ncbi:MAG: 23S rRNA (pseudouridine(1915)-N(3))-methyltransferase RlmH [Candidatus Aminicenantaceae bacterium]
MKLKILWPGKTKDTEIRKLQEFYLERINHMEYCEIIQTKEARGINEKFADRIKEIEAKSLEKHLKDDYIICLFDGGKEMSSFEFSRFLKDIASSPVRGITFVVGGFLGLSERILKKADFLLSFSRMTFSHELSRIIMLEQIYRALALQRGKQYVK